MRRRNARLYSEILGELDIITHFETDYTESMYHLYMISVGKKDELRERLVGSGISTGLHYPFPLHLQDAFGQPRYVKGNSPVAEMLADEAS